MLPDFVCIHEQGHDENEENEENEQVIKGFDDHDRHG